MKKRLILFIIAMITVLLLLSACGADEITALQDTTIPQDTTTSNVIFIETTPAEASPTETTPAPGVDVQKAVKDYFDWQPPQNYFVVENYEDLQAVYDMASEIPKITEYLVVEGNWRQARKENTYDQEYFKTGFLIAIMRKSSSMEEKSTYNINSVTGSIIRISMSSYETQVEFPAAYLDIIPIEGQYKGQEISLSLIYNPLP